MRLIQHGRDTFSKFVRLGMSRNGGLHGVPQAIEADYTDHKAAFPLPSKDQLQASETTPKKKKRVRNQRPKKDATVTNGIQTSRSNKTRRPKGESVRVLVIHLLSSTKFFDHERGANDIREELARQGHRFGSSEISAPLSRMTKKKFLSRERNENERWVYGKGKNSDYGGIE